MTTPQTLTPTGAAMIGSADPTDLHIMSFNIRLDRTATLPGQADYWPERCPALTELLACEAPTAVGVQEAMFHQLTAISDALPGHYRYIGQGREGGTDGEYSAIFYDALRLEVIEWDQFWLSDTPHLAGSATWGNTVTRIVTWGRFLDMSTGKELILVNTHFDHESENARLRSAEAIMELMEGFSPRLPTILTGDFNAPAAASGAYDALVGSGVFDDAWDAAAQKLTPAYGTFPNYKDPVPGGMRIDWILATPDVDVRQAAINTFTLEGRYPSDHAPVQALVRL
ncbi:endonuclease/exonuclease/phosphatase family protein [Pseudarthrobacter sp. J75]|uniref:endonuclease/exonuclease/phosphatase family protein n=1 Tax=unclassified Pseudarthrobacter TaxID=2647000 RepID=UPI002E80CFD2|nr:MULTISPECIES: endonuclease/exonuclease/phosphatase family protein [unclassified Pseudarthrobacter]MEE2523649.1 endonuclease/exonuclease/phosphatase family protein [Pseudarthrobacter sp. J47]MEE2530039.1 endonuclease/exonuclease/phosphatase family protein [Pseudarthrobacter sp. J75]